MYVNSALNLRQRAEIYICMSDIRHEYILNILLKNAKMNCVTTSQIADCVAAMPHFFFIMVGIKGLTKI